MAGPRPVLYNGMGQPQGIWDTTTSPVVAVGTRGMLSDGRVYYYARRAAGAAAIVAGNLLTTELQTAEFTEMAVDTEPIGAKVLHITLGATAVTVNEYAEGWVCVIDDTGEGITYKIDAHPAAAGAAVCNVVIRDGLHVGFGAGTTVQMVKNFWADLVIAPANAGVKLPAGVSNVAVATDAANDVYFWCQTWGIAAVLQDEINAIGDAIISGATAGGVKTWAASPEAAIGINIWTSADTEFAPTYLMIAP